MEIYQLKSFVAVAEEGNLTRAAARLFASQPAVSAHIKMLEEELGVVLFKRSRKGMTATREGEVLLEKGRRVLAEAQNLVNQAMSFRGELAGVVKIGLNSSPALLKISALVAAVMKSHPRLELHLIQSQANRVLKYVKNEQLDAGFFKGRLSDASFQALRLAKLNMVVTGPICLKAQIDNAGIEDLADMPWIWRTSCGPFMCFGDSLFSKACFRNSRVIVAEDDETMRSLLIGGAGLQLMEENKALADAAEGKVIIWPGEKIRTELSFVYLSRRQGDPMIQALCMVLGKVWGIPASKGLAAATT